MKTNFTLKRIYLLGTLIVSALSYTPVSYSQSKFVIEVSNTKFSPNELTVSVGDTVVWKNIQGYHNVNATKTTYPLNPESFGNAAGNGWTFQHVFTLAGQYDYQCDPHVGLGMVGKIHVTSNPVKYVVEVTRNVFTPDELKINPGDTVEWRNLEGYHNVNGTQATYPSNPESFGNSAGNGWSYNHVFHTPGKYDYRCDPHFSLGMTGKIEVMDDDRDDDSVKYMLTVNFTNMIPHVGQTLYLSVVDKNSGKEIERKSEDINASFSIQVSDIEKYHSYTVNFFADHNKNGMYDAPPADHAWSMDLDNVMGDTTLVFSHNTSFTDILWKNKLSVHFMGMNPHAGQHLNLAVIDKSTGMELQRVSAVVEPDFSVDVYGIEIGKSYNVDFYSDHNENGMYDVPPADHAWRMELNNVMGDTTLMFSHNTSFTDVMWKNRLTVHFMGMNPHAGQNLNLKVYDKNSGTMMQELDTVVAVDFMVYVYGIENGMSYNVDFYADHNTNGMYDVPPADHAWRLELNNVLGDTTLMFSHNINFTDIATTTGINEFSDYRINMYPNPANNRVSIETSGINAAGLHVRMYDITGKLKYDAAGITSNRIEIDLHPYANGVYLVELRTNDYRKMLKLLKN